MGSWGFVMRDHNGVRVMAGVRHMEAVNDPLSAENGACLAGLYAAISDQMGWSQCSWRLILPS
jgi:hypothetical protein